MVVPQGGNGISPVRPWRLFAPMVGTATLVATLTVCLQGDDEQCAVAENAYATPLKIVDHRYVQNDPQRSLLHASSSSVSSSSSPPSSSSSSPPSVSSELIRIPVSFNMGAATADSIEAHPATELLISLQDSPVAAVQTLCFSVFGTHTHTRCDKIHVQVQAQWTRARRQQQQRQQQRQRQQQKQRQLDESNSDLSLEEDKTDDRDATDNRINTTDSATSFVFERRILSALNSSHVHHFGVAEGEEPTDVIYNWMLRAGVDAFDRMNFMITACSSVSTPPRGTKNEQHHHDKLRKGADETKPRCGRFEAMVYDRWLSPSELAALGAENERSRHSADSVRRTVTRRWEPQTPRAGTHASSSKHSYWARLLIMERENPLRSVVSFADTNGLSAHGLQVLSVQVCAQLGCDTEDEDSEIGEDRKRRRRGGGGGKGGKGGVDDEEAPEIKRGGEQGKSKAKHAAAVQDNASGTAGVVVESSSTNPVLILSGGAAVEAGTMLRPRRRSYENEDDPDELITGQRPHVRHNNEWASTTTIVTGSIIRTTASTATAPPNNRANNGNIKTAHTHASLPRLLPPPPPTSFYEVMTIARRVEWLPIDAVIFINMDRRVDRHESILLELEHIGVPSNRIHRLAATVFDAPPNPPPSYYFSNGSSVGTSVKKVAAAGCADSFRRALAMALKHREWETVMIVEDDVRLYYFPRWLSAILIPTLSHSLYSPTFTILFTLSFSNHHRTKLSFRRSSSPPLRRPRRRWDVCLAGTSLPRLVPVLHTPGVLVHAEVLVHHHQQTQQPEGREE